MIEIKGLIKKYQSPNTVVTALNMIDLKLPNTGFVAIYGENGCGKTTLLNILSTADTDYEGTITYNDKNYRSIISELRRNVISFVFQEKYFIPYLNLYDNIELFSDDEDSELINKELADFSIFDKKTEKAKNLSGGQRQRSSIIRGVIKKSEVLLVDEPTSSLNEEMERAVFLKLQEYSKEKLVVLVSHNIRLIRSFADLIIHIDKGEIRSIENNFKTDIQYTGNEILVPFDFCDFSALDISYVKKKLNQHKSIIIRSYDDTSGNLAKLNYDIDNTHTDWMAPRKLSPKIKNKLISSSLKYNKGGIVFGICLISLFAIMINFLFSFAFFDKNEFVYQNIIDNIEGYINYKYDNSVYENKENVKLDVSSYRVYKDNYPTSKFLLVNYEAQPKFQFDSSGIYNDTVYGISFCDEDDVNLLCGSFSEEGEILLTDYSADALISYLPAYTDYAAIIEQGVLINGISFDVSGIIDTDYEKYKSIYFDESFINSQGYIDYQNSIKNLYSRIYYSLNQYMSNNTISYLALEYGATFCNTKNIEKNDLLFGDKEMTDDGCYINETLYNVIGEVDTLKINNDYLSILGVINDSDDKNIIYLSERKNELLKRGVLDDIASVMTQLSSADEVEFLNSHNMTHNTSISNYINKVIEIVTLTSKIFKFLIVILAVFLLGSTVVIVNKILSSDNVTLALLKSGGYDTRSILSLEACKIAISFALSSIVSSTLYIVCSYLINSVLSNLFGIQISISLIDAKIMLLTILVLLIVFAVVSIFMLIAKNKKKITDLINL